MHGAYDIQGSKMEDTKLASSVKCEQQKGPSWMCHFDVPWELMPAYTKMYSLQIHHYHHVKMEGGVDRSYVGALCPGPEGNFSWEGCGVDKRFFALKEDNKEEAAKD